MSPIIVDGCFAWLHVPEFKSNNVAVVLCPGLKSDELTGYSSLRLLAEALADQGYTTLRLQYLGTGNSRDPGPVEHWTTWQKNIHGASDWLRQNRGAEGIVLCGFRFGALLAATVAADRSDVAGLILLAPLLRGRSYIRQLMMEIAPSPEGSVDCVRFQLSPATTNLINQVELRKVRLPAGCKVAIFSQTSSAARADCEAIWKKAGVEVSSKDFRGLEPMLRPTFAIHEKPAVIDPIVSWLSTSVAAGRQWVPKHPPAQKIEVDSGPCIETPLFFGPDSGLFGILCQPYRAESPVVVLMGNSSCDPHCAGTTVDLARQLAAGGVASLRMDFSGVGDSSSRDGENHVFETDRGPDFSAAIDALEAFGYREFAAQGLCSGAYHAYHAAVADRRIGTVLLVNLPFFKWTTGFPVEDLIFDIRKPNYFLNLIQTRAFWTTVGYKFLHGDLNIRKRFAWLELKLRRIPGFGQDAPALARPVNMLFLVGEGDVAIEVLKRRFGAKSTPPGTRIQLVPELDHSMIKTNMRKIVASRMISFLGTSGWHGTVDGSHAEVSEAGGLRHQKAAREAA